MALYMPPIARKKRVPEKYNPDSFRVVSMNAEEFHPKFADNIIKPVYASDPRPARKVLPDIPMRETRILPHTTHDFRAHNPHPMSCGFLRHDARLLNEPICSVYTRTTHPEQHLWWPSRTSSEALQIPEYTRDSIYRDDYQFNKQAVPKGSSRHTANPNTEPALGSVPVNFLHSKDAAKRVFQEGISFEHQYDSRADPNYPARARRHGAFVWDKMKPDKVQLLLDYHESVTKRKADEEAQLQETCQQAQVESAPPGINSQYEPTLLEMDPNPLLIDTHPPIAMRTRKVVPAEPTTDLGPPSPPSWPYPQTFNSPPTQVEHSPSPQHQPPAVSQEEVTPNCNQRSNPEVTEVYVQDVGTSTTLDKS